MRQRARLNIHLLVPLLLSLGCTADPVPGDGAGSTSGSTGGASADGGGSGSDGGVGGSGSGAAGSGSVGGGGATGGSGSGGAGGERGDPELIPARIRRLSNAEYNASVQALLGTSQAPADEFPPDARQKGYTVNEAQRVDPVLARALDSAASKLAEEARPNFPQIAPCSTPETEGESCALSFIDDFGEKAYRRPLEAEDEDGLLALFRAGSTDGTYEDGIALIIRGILQSPGFLYVTELGSTPSAGAVSLTDYELASQLSFVVTGAPPDEPLLDKARAGGLSDPATREAEVRRLFETPAGRERTVRVVREWLGIDRIESTAKDANVYPEFADVRGAMARETKDFVLEVLDTTSGTVGDFLGSEWTVVEANLASLYGLGGNGRIETPNRVGLLNQGAFLSVYAHAHETAPVLRGVATMRRVACVDIELPTNLNVQIIPPLPDPTKTTRERFAIHSEDAACASCHSMIDPLGFSFEHFDGMGRYRDRENGQDVDSSADVWLGAELDGTYADSNELARALSTSDTVRECFARQIFRSGAGEAKGEAYEAAFMDLYSELPPAEQGVMLDLIVSFARSELFSKRGAP